MTMELGMGLYQEQTQKLVMTTQMKQAIELLQCSQAELDVLLAEEALNNPLAELLPAAKDEAFPWSARTAFSQTSQRAGGQAFPLEQMMPTQSSFMDQLEEQIRELTTDKYLATTAVRLIGYLDESGYLRESVEELAGELACSYESITDAIALLQSCEPCGLAAHDLRECLRLQVHHLPLHLQSVVLQLIDDCLEELAASHLPQIAKRLKLPIALIQQASDALRHLNPKPGLGLGYSAVQYVRPEVVVVRLDEGYVVMSNDGALPLLRVSPAYARLLETTDDAETQRFLMKKYHDARWLIRCVEQRRLTLYRVAEAIVHVQHRFFDEGPRGLRPLTLAQVATELGLHESTISRATRGKYMQTPRGLFEMKYFFKAEVAGDDGAVSAEAAKYCIRTCVDAEDPQHPLSDEAVCQQLSHEGIHISRRTVAKYRDEMNIPSSSHRRRFA